MTTVITISCARGGHGGTEQGRGCGAGRVCSPDRPGPDLVRWWAVHRVLTTGQLAALGFGSITTARHRLSVLVRTGLLRRFRPHLPTGSAPWHYVLGPVGAALLGVEDRDEHRWAPHVRADRQLALERSPRLGHMTGRNWFLAALVKDARERGGELTEWLNEGDTAARCEHAAVRVDDRARLPHPDGAGTWAEDGQTVSFLLEYDTGTEHLGVLAASWTVTGCWPPGWPGMGSPARSCCSASAPRAGSRPPAAPWPRPRTPGRCGSRRRCSTRASPARLGRVAAAAARPPWRPGAAGRPGAGAARPVAGLPGTASTRTPRGSRPRAGPPRRRPRRRARHCRGAGVLVVAGIWPRRGNPLDPGYPTEHGKEVNAPRAGQPDRNRPSRHPAATPRPATMTTTRTSGLRRWPIPCPR